MKTRIGGQAVAILGLWLGISAAFGFYDPSVQRWLNRDPVFEGENENLVKFLANAPTLSVDANGDAVIPIPIPGRKQIPFPNPRRPNIPYPRSRPDPKPDTPKVPPVPIPFPIPQWPPPGGKDPTCGVDENPQCEFYRAWCEWANDRPPGDPGKGWKRNAPCDECYSECKSSKGNWPFAKCPMGGPSGPRWPTGGKWPGGGGPVWPTPGQY